MFGVISYFFAVLFVFVIFKYIRYQQFVKQVGLPGPKPLPFIGSAHEAAGKPSFAFTISRWFLKYGDVIQVFIMNRRFVCLSRDEEAIKDVFSNKAFIKGDIGRLFDDAISRTGLIFVEGETWMRMRRICNGAFNTQHLQLFVNPMYSCIEVLRKKLSENVSTVDKIKPIEMDDIFMLLTLDIIGSTMFSVDLKSLEKGESELSKHVGIYLKEVYKHIINPLNLLNPFSRMRRKKSATFLSSFMEKLIEERIRGRASNATRDCTETKDLLDLLLDAKDPDTGNGLTKDELVDQVLTFMVAGHETTAHTLTFTIAQIAQNPHVAEILHKELDEVVGNAPNGKLKYEDVARLRYLTAVIKETLRTYPIAPAIIRVLDQDSTIAKCPIPKGSIISANVIAMHNNPKVWKNPSIFDPSRFLGEDHSEYKPPSHAYAPFGHGSRSCIGQHFALLEAKLILAAILQKFQFTLLPMESVSPVQYVTLRPKGGLRVTIWKRE